jgi:hypothetical protein
MFTHKNSQKEEIFPMTTPNIKRPVQWEAYGLRFIVALIATPIAGLIVYLIANAPSAMPATVLVGPMSAPITLVPVVLASVMGALAGIIVYALLLRFTRRPRRIFITMAVVVLVLAVVPTIGIGAPMAMVIALNVMHVVVGAVIVAVLAR